MRCCYSKYMEIIHQVGQQHMKTPLKTQSCITLQSNVARWKIPDQNQGI